MIELGDPQCMLSQTLTQRIGARSGLQGIQGGRDKVHLKNSVSRQTKKTES
jgi:hypothetical protein